MNNKPINRTLLNKLSKEILLVLHNKHRISLEQLKEIMMDYLETNGILLSTDEVEELRVGLIEEYMKFLY